VRIALPSDERPASDLTAKARIRDAAIECFAEQGFDASFRTIAGRAGVSPGLITHHFGSKEALRAECDTEVLRQYTAYKTDAVDMPTDRLFQLMDAPGVTASMMVYMLRAIHAGGQPARTFLERLIDDARAVMTHAVQTGLVRPSRDEEARLRYLTYQTMGALLVQFVTSPQLTPEAFVAHVQDGAFNQVLPTLELFTEGFLTNRQMLDDYVRYREQLPDADAEADPQPQPQTA
jgi:AcrR family transcriptional regulator